MRIGNGCNIGIGNTAIPIGRNGPPGQDDGTVRLLIGIELNTITRDIVIHIKKVDVIPIWIDQVVSTSNHDRLKKAIQTVGGIESIRNGNVSLISQKGIGNGIVVQTSSDIVPTVWNGQASNGNVTVSSKGGGCWKIVSIPRIQPLGRRFGLLEDLSTTWIKDRRKGRVDTIVIVHAYGRIVIDRHSIVTYACNVIGPIRVH